MIQGNPIGNQRMMEKFALGFDHLVDFLEKRMMEYLAQHPGVDLQRLDAIPPRSPQSGWAALLSGEVSTTAAQRRQEPSAQNMSMAEKLELLRKEGCALINDLVGQLGTTKRSIAVTQSLDEALSRAQAVRKMKPGVDQMKTLIPPIPKPSPPLIQKTDDKLTAVKKTLNVALLDLEKVLSAALTALQATKDPRVIVQIVKTTKSLSAALVGGQTP